MTRLTIRSWGHRKIRSERASLGSGCPISESNVRCSHSMLLQLDWRLRSRSETEFMVSDEVECTGC